MVNWEAAHPDVQWTQAAWEGMGLSSPIHACIKIDDKYVPDQGFKRSRSWFFCTASGADKAGLNANQLPTFNTEDVVFLCSMGRGAQPSFEE